MKAVSLSTTPFSLTSIIISGNEFVTQVRKVVLRIRCFQAKCVRVQRRLPLTTVKDNLLCMKIGRPVNFIASPNYKLFWFNIRQSVSL